MSAYGLCTDLYIIALKWKYISQKVDHNDQLSSIYNTVWWWLQIIYYTNTVLQSAIWHFKTTCVMMSICLLWEHIGKIMSNDFFLLVWYIILIVHMSLFHCLNKAKWYLLFCLFLSRTRKWPMELSHCTCVVTYDLMSCLVAHVWWPLTPRSMCVHVL